MNSKRLKMFDNYFKANISPLLVDNIVTSSFKNAVVLKADIPRELLNGHYEDTNFWPPLWYRELISKSIKDKAILIIENINEIPLLEQKKFIEILKYKKISTFDIPDNCLIIVTCKDLEKNKINEEVYSLLVHI